jgi:hypothetical protein
MLAEQGHSHMLMFDFSVPHCYTIFLVAVRPTLTAWRRLPAQCPLHMLDVVLNVLRILHVSHDSPFPHCVLTRCFFTHRAVRF